MIQTNTFKKRTIGTIIAGLAMAWGGWYMGEVELNFAVASTVAGIMFFFQKDGEVRTENKVNEIVKKLNGNG